MSELGLLGILFNNFPTQLWETLIYCAMAFGLFAAILVVAKLIDMILKGH